MTAIVRRTYVISCDHRGTLPGYAGHALDCGIARQFVIPDDVIKPSEYVRSRLRALGWAYVGGLGHRPTHYCPKHKPKGREFSAPPATGGARQSKIRTEGK